MMSGDKAALQRLGSLSLAAVLGFQALSQAKEAAFVPEGSGRDWNHRFETRPSEIDLSQWSLEEKAGQLLMVGFRSLDQIREIKPAGVILFSWNMPSVDATKSLTLKLESLSRESLRDALFIATDHEGGEVLRLRKGLTSFPDAAAVGATGDAFTAFRVGKAMGHELAALGINMNLAPVMDLGNARSFLRNRVWGEDGGPVGRLTTAYIRGLQAARVLAVAKHFPGHGGSAKDSHFALPRIHKPFANFWKEDLEPFRQAIQEGVHAVMTAHVEVAAIDRGPASLSEKFVTKLLRDELKFEGLVLTDDVEMAGAGNVRGTSLEDLSLRALKAGTDLIMVVWSESKQRRIRDRIVEAVRSGEVSQTWLDEKVRRIASLRKAYVASGGPWQNPFWRENLRRPESVELAASIPRRALKWLAGDSDSIVPSFSRSWDRSWLVVVPEGRSARYWRQFRSRDEVFVYRRGPTASQLKSLRRLIRAADDDQRPLLVVTGPRAASTEENFRAIREELGRRSLRRAGSQAPALWVHQGSRPVELRHRDPAALGVGIVSLYSASIASLMALSSLLQNGTVLEAATGENGKGAWN